jgi:hypothetical protein
MRYGAGRLASLAPLAGDFYRIDRASEGEFYECLNVEGLTGTFRDGPLSDSRQPPITYRHGESRLGDRAIAVAEYFDVNTLFVRLLNVPGIDRIAAAIDAGKLGVSLRFTTSEGGEEWMPPVKTRSNPRGLPVRFVDRYTVEEVTLIATPANRATKVKWSTS